MSNLIPRREPTPTTTSHGAFLVGHYFQTSRKYRSVARFPEVDGQPIPVKDALRRGMIIARRLFPIEGFDPNILQPHEERWLAALDEDAAGEHFLCCYADYSNIELCLDLTREQFEQFRAAGGEHYDATRALIRFKEKALR